MNKKAIVVTIFVAVILIGASVGIMGFRKHDDAKTNSGQSTSNGTKGSSDSAENASDTPASNSNGANNNGSSSSNNNSNGSATTTPGAVATTQVAIGSAGYSPNNIVVKVGTSVTWTNNDTTQHTITIDDGDGPHSQPLNKGDTYTYTFNTAGTFNYHCTFHPEIKGKVVVE